MRAMAETKVAERDEMRVRDEVGKRRAVDLTPTRMSSFLSCASFQCIASPWKEATRIYLMGVDGVVHDAPRHSAEVHRRGDRPVHGADNG